MNFKEWMLQRGLSASTAEKYAGAVSGPLSEWGLAAGLIEGPLVAMESPATYAEVTSKLTTLPIFIERNARGHNMYSSALAKFAGYLEEGFSGEVGADIEGVLSDVSINPTEKLELLIRHGLLQSPDAVQLEPVEGLRHLSPSKVYE